MSKNTSLSLPISINNLLHARTVESERIEFKEGWNPENVLHSMCAFANDFHNLGGGYIIIGVAEEQGNPIFPPKGLNKNQIARAQKEIFELGKSSIQPHYHPITSPEIFQGENILIIWVPGGETRPYRAKAAIGKHVKEWNYYIRKQSSTVKVHTEDINELFSLAATVPFDDRYCQSAQIDALSKSLISEFLTDVNSRLLSDIDSIEFQDLAYQMNIIGGPSEAVFPKNIGLLFFNDHPEKYFPQTQIDIVWMPTNPEGDYIEEKTFTGPLSHILRDSLNYIQRHFLRRIIIKQPNKAEAIHVWNYPLSAIEEALVNAVYHRSYEIREPIEVQITHQEISILSFPGPDRSIQMQAFTNGRVRSRRYRNRRIGEFLKELNLSEGRSTGIPKILNALKENGSAPAQYETDEDRTYFLIQFFSHPQNHDLLIGEDYEDSNEIIEGGNRGGNQNIMQENTDLEGGNRGGNQNIMQENADLEGGNRGGNQNIMQENADLEGGNQLSDTKMKIIEGMKNNPRISMGELSQQLNIGINRVERHINTLKKLEIIRRVGGTRGYWEVL